MRKPNIYLPAKSPLDQIEEDVEICRSSTDWLAKMEGLNRRERREYVEKETTYFRAFLNSFHGLNNKI